MNLTQALKHGLIAVVLALLTGLSGCAHNTNPRDPFESFNRGVYAFNDGVDTAILRPIAQGYRAVLPQVVRTGVSNFFSNLDDITVIVNGVLQLKIPQATADLGRFLINSTIGLLGLVDVAGPLGLEKHNEDFGQTLGYWGIGSGPYLVLPLFGPSSFRDAIGRWADFYTDVVWQINDIRWRNVLYGTRVVSNRTRLLDTELVLKTAAIDEYSFVRDAYLQRRRNLVYDGNPPPDPDEDEPAEKPKPGTSAEPPLKSVLVDQFGEIVAGGEPTTGGIAPLLTEETSKALSLPKSAPPERSSEEPKAQIPPVTAADDRPQQSPARDEPPIVAQSPIVRVWLPANSGK